MRNVQMRVLLLCSQIKRLFNKCIKCSSTCFSFVTVNSRLMRTITFVTVSELFKNSAYNSLGKRSQTSPTDGQIMPIKVRFQRIEVGYESGRHLAGFLLECCCWPITGRPYQIFLLPSFEWSGFSDITIIEACSLYTSSFNSIECVPPGRQRFQFKFPTVFCIW